MKVSLKLKASALMIFLLQACGTEEPIDRLEEGKQDEQQSNLEELENEFAELCADNGHSSEECADLAEIIEKLKIKEEVSAAAFICGGGGSDDTVTEQK
ncbi:MAG: hypothetical protein HRU19_03230 [Pseudobacteriovorax sp.]|nr:hypothetical protein [Pseudobacteriovorax sp.]